jgi:hypothetical protein
MDHDCVGTFLDNSNQLVYLCGTLPTGSTVFLGPNGEQMAVKKDESKGCQVQLDIAVW